MTYLRLNEGGGKFYYQEGKDDNIENIVYRVDSVRRIGIDELEKLEPYLDVANVQGALYSSEEYIVDPWLLGIIPNF